VSELSSAAQVRERQPGPLDATSADVLAPRLRELAARASAERGRVVASILTRTGAPDDEAVHDFRVALRRLRSLLRPARALYGEQRTRAVERELRDVAATTGALRDEEVLRETLSALALAPRTRATVVRWLASREKRERAQRRSVARGLAGPVGERLTRAVEALDALLARPKRELSTGRLARRVLRALARQIGALAREPVADVVAMHELRIRWKRARYFCELLERVGAPIALAKPAAQLQKRLGELHDLDEAVVRVRRARSLSRRAQHAVLVALGRARATVAAALAPELLGSTLLVPEALDALAERGPRVEAERSAEPDDDRAANAGRSRPRR
jgi:CHAD domain-containing protein